jgi:hypothetical protein
VDDREALQAAVHVWSEKQRRARGEHPSPEELLDYHLGDLAAGERERLQEHLAVCADCSRTVLDLAAFPEVEPDGGSGAPAEAEWERLRRQAFPGRRPATVQLRTWGLLAASLLIAVLGGYWAGRQSRPAAEVFVASLVPIEEVRSASEPEFVRVPRWARAVVLSLLPPPGSESRPDYEVELVDQGGKVVWGRGGLRANADGEVAVSVPRLPAGTYGINLYGLPGRTPAGEYAVQLEYE